MEIEFGDLVYAKNNKIDGGYIYLNSLNYKFECGNVYSLVGDASEIVGRLLVLDKRPTKGSVSVNGQSISKTSKNDNLQDIKRDLRFIDFSNKFMFAKSSFMEELLFLSGCNNDDRIVKIAEKSLTMVGLDVSFIDRDLWKLSVSESKKVLLALNLCLNPKLLVLKDIDKGLIYKDKIIIKRLLYKLMSRYNKMIVLIVDDVTFMFDLVTKVLVFDGGQILINGGKDVLYDDRLYEYLDKPKIVEFIQFAKSKNHDIDEYVDNKELLKGIFRDIENK